LAAHALFLKMTRSQTFLELVKSEFLDSVCAHLSQPLSDAAKEGAAQNEKDAFEARRRAAAAAVKALAETLPAAALQSQVMVELLQSEAYAKSLA
jgi:predicted extracellular nuclease